MRYKVINEAVYQSIETLINCKPIDNPKDYINDLNMIGKYIQEIKSDIKIPDIIGKNILTNKYEKNDILNQLNRNKKEGLIEYTKFLYNKLNEFLYEYCIGECTNIKLYPEYVFAEINIIISKEAGPTLVKDYYIEDTNTNKQALQDILEKIGGKITETYVKKNKSGNTLIEKIDFNINLSEIDKLMTYFSNEEINEEILGSYKATQINSIAKSLNKYFDTIRHEYVIVSNSWQNNILSKIIFSYNKLCNLFNIYNEYNKEFSEIDGENTEETIAIDNFFINQYPYEGLGKDLNIILKELNNYSLNNIGMYCSEIYISPFEGFVYSLIPVEIDCYEYNNRNNTDTDKKNEIKEDNFSKSDNNNLKSETCKIGKWETRYKAEEEELLRSIINNKIEEIKILNNICSKENSLENKKILTERNTKLFSGTDNINQSIEKNYFYENEENKIQNFLENIIKKYPHSVIRELTVKNINTKDGNKLLISKIIFKDNNINDFIKS